MSKVRDIAICGAAGVAPFALAGLAAIAGAVPASAGQCGHGNYSKGWRVDPKTGECIPPQSTTTHPPRPTTTLPTVTTTAPPNFTPPTTVPSTVPIVPTTVPSVVIVCDDVDPAFRAAISVPYVVEDCSVGTATSVARPQVTTPPNKPNTLPATGTDGTRYLVVIGGLLVLAGYAVAKGAQVPKSEREG